MGYEGDPADATTNTSATRAAEQPAQPTGAAAPTTHSTGGTTGGIVTPTDLPKSGVVSTDGSGQADIAAKQQPGYLSSAAGSHLADSFGETEEHDT